MKIRLVLALGLVLCAASAFTQDEKAMMEAYEKAAAPGDAHKKLAAFAGTWDVKSKAWMSPEAPPMESSGTAEMRMIFDGRFLEQRFDGAMMGRMFSGVGYTGYDNIKKHYLATWIDNMSTTVMVMAGATDATGTIWKSASMVDDPLTGKTARVEMKTTVIDPNHHIMEMWYPAPDGKMFKTLELHYFRKK